MSAVTSVDPYGVVDETLGCVTVVSTKGTAIF